MVKWLDELPISIILIGVLTLGLAPFIPEPHLVEKIKMLLAGQLNQVIDIFDIFMHGAFPILLLLKLFRLVFQRLKKT